MQLSKLVLNFLSIIVLFFFIDGCSTRYPTTHHVHKYHSKHYLQALQKASRRWHGVAYRYGGESKRGVDCSGLVQRVYAEAFSLHVPRTTRQQAKIGFHIRKSDLVVGDLILFKTGYNTFHSAIYLEKGKFLHASTKYGVRISHLSNAYWQRTYYTARRVLP